MITKLFLDILANSLNNTIYIDNSISSNSYLIKFKILDKIYMLKHIMFMGWFIVNLDANVFHQLEFFKKFFLDVYLHKTVFEKFDIFE